MACDNHSTGNSGSRDSQVSDPVPTTLGTPAPPTQGTERLSEWLTVTQLQWLSQKGNEPQNTGDRAQGLSGHAQEGKNGETGHQGDRSQCGTGSILGHGNKLPQVHL